MKLAKAKAKSRSVNLLTVEGKDQLRRTRRELMRRLVQTVALKDTFRTDNGGFDLAAFKACLKENGVTPPNVDGTATAPLID